MLDPQSRPRVRLAEAVQLLARHRVRWILTGSAVLAVYGADLTPNDLDVTPDLDPDNLHRLATVLAEVDAIPGTFPAGLPDSASMNAGPGSRGRLSRPTSTTCSSPLSA